MKGLKTVKNYKKKGNVVCPYFAVTANFHII